jgi:hypothetical protein
VCRPPIDLDRSVWFEEMYQQRLHLFSDLD